MYLLSCYCHNVHMLLSAKGPYCTILLMWFSFLQHHTLNTGMLLYTVNQFRPYLKTTVVSLREIQYQHIPVSCSKDANYGISSLLSELSLMVRLVQHVLPNCVTIQTAIMTHKDMSAPLIVHVQNCYWPQLFACSMFSSIHWESMTNKGMHTCTNICLHYGSPYYTWPMSLVANSQCYVAGRCNNHLGNSFFVIETNVGSSSTTQQQGEVRTTRTGTITFDLPTCHKVIEVPIDCL